MLMYESVIPLTKYKEGLNLAQTKRNPHMFSTFLRISLISLQRNSEFPNVPT